MTLFEYVAVAASLVCSFAAARVLGGIAATLQRERRYWVHATWAFSILFGISLAWWIFWSYREVEWNYLRFLIALFPLGLLYILASLLVPGDPDSITSWRNHYEEIRVRFFALNLVYLAANTLNAVLLLGQPVFDQRRAVTAAIGALWVAGMVSANPKLHAAIVLLQAGALVVAAAAVLEPGSMGATQ